MSAHSAMKRVPLPSWRSARILWAAAALILAGLPVEAGASEWGWSPGLKLAWTPGHGLTYGLEVSFVRLPDILDAPTGSLGKDALQAGADFISRTYGIVIDAETNFGGLTRLRLGGEWIGPFIGLEVGPSLVIDSDHGTHAGLSFTPWAGYEFLPYYTYTVVFGGAPNLHDIGFYLKSPLLGFGGGSSSHDGHHLDD